MALFLQTLQAMNLHLWKVPAVAIDFRQTMSAGGIAVFAEITDTLTRLCDAGVRLALATSNSREVVIKLSAKTGR